MKPLELANLFHEAYERLAPEFGYETREETRVFDPNSANGRLMIATCVDILRDREVVELGSESFVDLTSPSKHCFVLGTPIRVDSMKGRWFSLGFHVDWQKRYVDFHVWWWIVTIGRDYVFEAERALSSEVA